MGKLSVSAGVDGEYRTNGGALPQQYSAFPWKGILYAMALFNPDSFYIQSHHNILSDQNKYILTTDH